MLQDSENSSNNPHSIKRIKIKAERIFLSKSKKKEPDACWDKFASVCSEIIATYFLAPVSYRPRYDLPEQRSLDTLDRETKSRELASGGGNIKRHHKSYGGRGAYIHRDF